MSNLPAYKILSKTKSSNWSKLQPEQKICVEFAATCRQMSIEGNLPYIWFHIPNEYYRGSQATRKSETIFGSILNQMGRIPGVADYCFIGKERSFFIEFKTKTGSMSEAQKLFKEWCESLGIEYHICRSPKEGINLL